MNKQALSLAVCIAGAYPLSSGAIGLGDIRSSSHLNQPLNAKIELLSTSTQEAKQVQVRLASSDVFNRVGIDRPAYLNSLKFTSTIQNGKPVILVSSNQPIKEPFLNFLLEVSWPKGQLLKEYTVLLDPPVLLQSSNTSEGNAAAVRAEPKATGGFVQRPKPVQQQTKARNQQNQVTVSDGIKLDSPAQAAPTQRQSKPAPSSSRKSKYRVKSGDTLYKIAARVKPRGTSADQMMVALFRANPDAFRKGNINRLKAGSRLKVPSSSKAKSISSSSAKKVIRQHYAEWKQYRRKLAGKTVPQKSVKAQARVKQTKTPTNKNTSAKNAANKARLEVMGNKKGSGAKSNSKVSAAGQVRIAQLDKQLSLAQEALVSKKRENTELKSRVTEMESIIQKKNRLITLKNSQIAKLQNSLSKSNSGTSKTTTNNRASTPTSTPPINKDISAHIANKANQDAGNITRTQQAANNTNSTPPANNGKPPQARKENLTPAALAEKRREAAMSENGDSAMPVANTGFKPEKENSLLELLSSPIVAAAGAGSILLLLLGWLLLSRKKNKVSKGTDDDDTLAALDDFDENFTSLDDDLNPNIDDIDSDSGDFFNDLDSDQQDIASAQSSDALSTAEKPQTDNVSTSLESEEDDILQEADVYIVYGLHEQAEAELKKAIKDNPNKLEYRHKLLENYLASNNKEAFDAQAEEIHKLDGSNKASIWEKVVEMGRKISPDNVLYQATENSSPNMSDSATLAAAGATAVAVAAAVVATNSAEEDSQQADDTEAEDDFNLDDLLADTSNDAENQQTSIEETTETTNNLSDFDEIDNDFADFGLDDDDFSLDDLERELDEKVTDLSENNTNASDDESNVIDFESMLLDDENKPTNEAVELTNLNLEVDEQSGISKILPQGTPYTSQDDNSVYGEEEDDILSFLDLPEEDIDLHEAHISTKIDLARAYLDMGDIEGARSTLEEVIVEGSDEQKREAENLLHQTG